MANYRYELLKGVPFINVLVEGRCLSFVGHFVVDTGSFMTIVRTSRIDAMGYSARDAVKPFSTESVIDKEIGMNLLNQFDWCIHPKRLSISVIS